MRAECVKGYFLPAITFDTPSSFTPVYTTQRGRAELNGSRLSGSVEITISNFQSGGASGNLIITGFPLPIDQRIRSVNPLIFANVVKSGYTQFAVQIITPGGRGLVYASNPSNGAQAGLTASDITAGGDLILNFNFSYFVQPQDYPPVERAFPQLGRLFMGDSLTANWTIPFAYAANWGIPGDTTANMLSRFDLALATSAANKVIILAGTNDAIQVLNMTTAVSNVLAMAQKCVGRKVIICTIPPLVSSGIPISITSYNGALISMAQANDYKFCDFYSFMVLPNGGQDPSLFQPDGIHPNSLGYQRIQPLIESFL